MNTRMTLLLGLVLALTLQACLAPDECQTDEDCAAMGEGMVCSESYAGAYRVAVCTLPLEGTVAVGCNQECANAGAIVAESVTCQADFTTVCALVCSADGASPTGTLDSCDDDMQNGCETDLSTSIEHCGACGNDCTVQFAQDNVTGICDAGSCSPTACEDTWVDANANLEDGCTLSFDKTALENRSMAVGATVGIVRAQGVTTAVDLNGTVNSLPDDTAKTTSTLSPNTITQVSSVRGANSGLGRVGSAVLVGTDGSSASVAEIVLWNSDGELEFVDMLPDVVAAELVPSMKVDVEAEDYVFDVFAMTEQTLTWYAYLRSGKPAQDLFGEDKVCEELTVTVLSNLKRCTVASVTGVGDLLQGTPENVRAKRSRPGGDVIVVTSGQSVRQVRAFIRSDSSEWLRILEEATTAPSDPSVGTVKDVEVWRDVDGSVKGVAFAGVTGGKLQVEFMETVESNTEVSSREQRKLTDLDAAINGRLDLVPFGDGRFLLVNDEGLFVASSRDGEELVRLSEDDDKGWDAGDDGGGQVSVTRNSDLFLIPVP